MVHPLERSPRNSKFHKELDTFVHFVENILSEGLLLGSGNVWLARNRSLEELGN